MSQKLTPSKSACSIHLRNLTQPQQHDPQSQHPFLNYLQQSYTKSSQKHSDPQQSSQQRQYRQQIDKQCKMRIQSIIKGYQLKISKEQQTFQLKQKKYLEQIQYLKKQLKQLSNSNKCSKMEINQSHHCNICSNGSIITLLKQMLDKVQNQHRGCSTQKNILKIKLQATQQKLLVSSNQNQQIQLRYTKTKNQLISLRNQRDTLQFQFNNVEKQLNDKDKQNKNKQILLKKQNLKLKDDIQILEKSIQIMEGQKNKNSIYQQIAKSRQHLKQSWKQASRHQQQQSIKLPYKAHQQPYSTYQQTLRDKFKIKGDKVLQPLSYANDSTPALTRQQQIHIPITKQPPSQHPSSFYKDHRIPSSLHQSKSKLSSSSIKPHSRYSIDGNNAILDYHNKYKKTQNQQGLLNLNAIDNFDTFRPKFSHQIVNHAHKGSHLIKHHFLEF